jgi:hypothetical protein
LSQQELKDNPDLFNLSNPAFKNIDASMLQQIGDKVKSGGVEFYFHSGVGEGAFTDNINALKQVGQLPTTGADLKSLCDQLPGVFTKYFGRPISQYQCSFTHVDGKNAMLTEFDGAAPGTRSIQYEIQKSDSIMLLITGTFALGTLEQERSTFTKIVQSVHMK